MSQHDQQTDPRTGLANRWYLDLIFNFVFELGDRGVAMTLVVFALDGIDDYAAERGEEGREAVVEGFGKLLGDATRKIDVTARHGADRFQCLLLACNLQGGVVFADRIRAEAVAFTKATGLTVSAGIASYSDDMVRRTDLEDAAARALGVAQAEGGDGIGLPRDVPD